MKPRDCILEQIHHRETSPVPYTLGFEEDVGERLDEHYGGPEWRERIVRYFGAGYGVDTTKREKIDEVYDRDAFGSLWRMDLRPFHLEKPGLAEPSFDGYEFPKADLFLENADEAKADACKAIDADADGFHMIGMGWGLFEHSWGIRGFENAMMDAVGEQDFYGELLDRLVELYLQFIEHCADVPADAVMFGDDWGDQRGVILGPKLWRKFMKPRWARLYEAVHAQGKLVISHCCGSVADIMPDVIEIGLDVLESVQPEAQGMNPYGLKRKWGDKLAFWGGLGSQSTIPFGTPDEIHAEVRRLRSEMGKGGGYILAPAKPLQPETPIENAVATVEAFTTS